MCNDKKTRSYNDYQRYDQSNVSHRCTISTYPQQSFCPNKKTNHPPETLEKSAYALSYIAPDTLSRIERTQIATALKNEFGESANNTYINWVSQSSDYNKSKYKSIWKNAGKYQTSIKTLYHHARQNGYKEQSARLSKAEYAKQQREIERHNAKRAEREAKRKANYEAGQGRLRVAMADISAMLEPADRNSTIYIKNKKADGKGAYTLKGVPLTARNIHPFSRIKNKALVIPLQNQQGECVGMEVIDNGNKQQVKGTNTKGAFAYIGLAPMPYSKEQIFIGEGYGTVNTAVQAKSDSFGVMAVGSENLPLVAELVRSRHPYAQITILCDNDKSGAGQKASELAAKACDGIVLIPEWIDGQVKSTDWNDVHLKHGLEVVRYLLGKNPASSSEQDSFLEALIEESGISPIAVINQRYLGDTINKAFKRLDVKFLIVKSGMKTGKTTASKEMIKAAGNGNFLVITSRTELNRAIAAELGLNFYKDVLTEKDPVLRLELAKRLVITPNSLPKILRDFPDIVYNTIFIDESETAAGMLVSDATDRKVLTLETLRIAALKAKRVVLMDAHVGTKTNCLMEQIADKNKIGKVINKYKPWSDIKISVIYSDEEKNRAEIEEKALTISIMNCIREGKRPYVCSNTKAFCERLVDQINANYSIKANVKKKMIILSGGNKNDEYKALMENTDSVVMYEVVIGSPAVNVGVSFNKKHFHKCFGHFRTNNRYTGDADDAVQALARARNLIDKEWIVILPESGQVVFNNATDTPQDIADAINDRTKKNIEIIQRPVPMADSTELRLLELYTVCKHDYYQSKNNFYNRVIDRFNEMGCSIEMVDANTIKSKKQDEISIAYAKKKKKLTGAIKLQTGVALDDEQYQVANKAIKRVENVQLKSFIESLEDSRIISVSGRESSDREIMDYMIQAQKTYKEKNTPYKQTLESMGLSALEDIDNETIDESITKAKDKYKSKSKTYMAILEGESIISKGGNQLSISEYEEIKFDLKFKSNQVEKKSIDAIERHQVESKLGISFSELKDDHLKTSMAVALMEMDAPLKCQKREIGLSSNEFTKKYTRGRYLGFGTDKAFKVEIVDNKLNFAMERKLYKYALGYVDQTFTHQSLKRSALVQWVTANKKTLTALEIISLDHGWNKKPANLLKDLLKKMGYSIKGKQVKKKGKTVREWTVMENKSIKDYYEKRQREGMNWVLNTEYIISKYEGIVGYVLSEDDLSQYRITTRDVLMVSELLGYIPVREHKKAIEQYKTVIKLAGNQEANKAMIEEYKTSEFYNSFPCDKEPSISERQHIREWMLSQLSNKSA